VQWLVQRTSAAKYVRKRNAHGLAPIHGACLKSQLLVVEYLADHGAAGDLWNAKTQSLDHTALSVSAGNTEVMDWLHAKFKTAASPAQ
jgi:ankyrin repeat protein